MGAAWLFHQTLFRFVPGYVNASCNDLAEIVRAGAREFDLSADFCLPSEPLPTAARVAIAAA
jgi:hypothetical protein